MELRKIMTKRKILLLDFDAIGFESLVYFFLLSISFDPNHRILSSVVSANIFLAFSIARACFIAFFFSYSSFRFNFTTGGGPRGLAGYSTLFACKGRSLSASRTCKPKKKRKDRPIHGIVIGGVFDITKSAIFK